MGNTMCLKKYLMVFLLLLGGLPWGIKGAFAHPFDQLNIIEGASSYATSAFLDLNNDGNKEFMQPGIFIIPLVNSFDANGKKLKFYVGTGLTGLAALTTWGNVMAMGAGRVDSDSREDLVTFSSTGAIRYFRNLGSNLLDKANFAAPVLIDNTVTTTHPINPPFVGYSVPYLKVFDMDNDGLEDIVVLGSNVDNWSGTTINSFFKFFKGDGTGSFTLIETSIPGNVVDAEFVDLDGNQTPDTMALLVEVGSYLSSSYLYDVHHYSLVGNQLTQVGLPQVLQFADTKFTSFELTDLNNDGNKDYVFSLVTGGGGGSAVRTSSVCSLVGDGQGSLIYSSWNCLNQLPANNSGLNSDYIVSLQVSDFDFDGVDDLALTRSFAELQGTAASSGPTLRGTTSVFFLMGDPSTGNFLTSPAEEELLSATASDCNSMAQDHNAFLKPYTGHPDYLAVGDFGSNGVDDLVVSCMRFPMASSTSSTGGIITFKNLTPTQTGSAGYEQVGDATGANTSNPAHAGFDGGKPEPGNSNFKATYSNLRGNQITTLIWGSYGQSGLIPIHGIELHISPDQFGYWGLSSGQGATDGHFQYDLPIPNDPALIGDAGYFQFLHWDNHLESFGASEALHLFIGN